MRKILLILLSFTLIKAQKVIIPVEDNFELTVKVSIRDTIFPSGDAHYIYEYTLINSPSSGQPVEDFEIPWFSYSQDVSPYPYQLGDTSYSVLSIFATVGGRASWIGLEKYLKPGDTANGFVFITKELPDISDWHAEGIDTILCPEVEGLDEETAEDTVEKLFYDKTPYGPGKVGKTVGPGPFPPEMDLGLYHLRSKVEECYKQGWMEDRARRHLKGMYERALRHYENGRFNQSKRVLTQVMEYLDRERGKLIRDESYYILYYRTRYVRDHLFGGGDPR